MSKPRVIVVRAPGTNCDQEAVHAWQLVGAACDLLHLHRLVEQPGLLDGYDILTLPGGFSYGDDISAGRIFANRLVQRTGAALHKFRERQRLILGICNGFQVLVKTGLLPANAAGQRCTLAFNESGVFTCRWVTLESAASPCLFLEPGRRYFLPIAHAEGRFAVAPGSTLEPRRVALRYVPGPRRVGPANPNGSHADVAGLTDDTGRVLGLMPHPERFVDATQHPFHTSPGVDAAPDGLAIFRAAAACFR